MVTAAGRPCSPTAAVTVARSLVGTGVYELGTGDWDTPVGAPSDCAGFAICRCYGLRRHRPGFNRGVWSSVEDDLNCNSAIEDADHNRELFVRGDRPELGDLIAYPTIRLPGSGAGPWIGHIAIVVGVDRARNIDMTRPDWSLLDVVQCCGPSPTRPNGIPGIIASNGAHWNDHDRTWPKLKHRTALLRLVP